MRPLAMIPLYLPALLARQIEQEAVRAYPDECCGIMIGRDASARIIERIGPVQNVFEECGRFHRFAIDPLQLMAAERDAAGRGQVVLGFYHSHPDHPARPSDVDRESAWPFYSYVIVSIIRREPVDMTSWVLDDQTKSFGRQDIVKGE